ncbi:Peptidase, M23/M37 family [Liberibacter crescens BT-1]|uniref:Peptidase, M23/M37 family n=1 Tax=Liberibacter crescens (strain BT-1) TaxID=1215343 RepID=L0EV52_LIBCB|nr:M23 family metallopeptidase [Liberibacter crescens]AGA64276.1 Peptidase, M23/M37 family [Liberibacter crescens BT-1]
MGAALFTALNGHQKIARPAKEYSNLNNESLNQIDKAKRGGRLSSYPINNKNSDKFTIEVPTLVKDTEKETLKKVPFTYIKMNLATESIKYKDKEDYPKFDPINIFSSGESIKPQTTLYDAEIKSEVSIKKSDFPQDISNITLDEEMPINEIEKAVREKSSAFTNSDIQLSMLYYAEDPENFSIENDSELPTATKARIIEENKTITASQMSTPDTSDLTDNLIRVPNNITIANAIANAGYATIDTKDVIKTLEEQLHFTELKKGNILRIATIEKGEHAKIIRVSIYESEKHILTVALNDNGKFVIGSEPASKLSLDDDTTPILPSNMDLPNIYDAVWRSSLSSGLNNNLVQLIIKLLANSVDLKSQLKQSDYIEVFFTDTSESELLYANVHCGNTQTHFYRFQNPQDKSIDYFDENGKRIRPFLLRSPVPGARITSGFGARVHPILGYTRMHTGVDWAAPRGTPILAVGDGVVEKAGWAGGYGKQTIIRHGNGYLSSYNHQNNIAKNIKVGGRVKQGQVIGWIGTTGLSTGPHLHYELIVNQTKVDSTKIRLPGGDPVPTKFLNHFKSEVKRINALIKNGEKSRKLASR